MITIETIKLTKDLIKWRSVYIELGMDFVNMNKRKSLRTDESMRITNFLKEKGIELKEHL